MLPMLLRHIQVDPQRITVIEKDDHQELFDAKYGSSGVTYVIHKITWDDLHKILERYLEEGDLLVNLSTDIDCIELVTWCLRNGVRYIDTSIERWPHETDEVLPTMAERTLYHAHQEMRAAAVQYEDAATCVVTYGANPGIVTQFVKAALLDMAASQGHEVDIPTVREEWAQLMMLLGVKVVHISERDTQILDTPKEKNEFVNTWSCEGFWAEGRAPAELGWGTHEHDLPANAGIHADGPQNAIYLEQPGVSVMLKSWAPLGGAFNGFCIQHSEAVTISEYFTTEDATFRPSVYYVYCPCDAAVVSVHEFRGHELEIQDKQRVAKAEIASGVDELGVFLQGDSGSWWYGSQLTVDQANRLLPGEGPTTVQVGAAMLSAIVWMIENPRRGYCEPEDLPFDIALKHALPYLGTMVSEASDWTPHADRNSLFENKVDPNNPWSFNNFRISS